MIAGHRSAELAPFALALVVFIGSAQAQVAPVLREARSAAIAGDRDGALAMIDAWLDAHPGDADALYLRAQILGWSDRFAESLQLYDVLLAREPRNPDYLFGRAQVAYWSGNPERSLADLADLRAAAPATPGLGELERQVELARVARYQERLWPGLDTETEPLARELTAGLALDQLDSGYDDWRSATLRYRGDLTLRLATRAGLHHAERYGRSDTEAELGGAWTSSRNWETGIDTTIAVDADFLPRWSLQLFTQASVSESMTMRAGLRRAEYAATHATTLSLSADRYVQRYRLAYNILRTDPADADTTLAHIFRIDATYGDTSFIGVQFAVGRESESDGRGGLLNTRTRSAALLGQHALGADWNLSWAAVWCDQGDLYQRTGLDVGIARRF